MGNSYQEKDSLSYNEVKQYLASTGGYNTKQYSSTNISKVKQEIHDKARKAPRE
ncbi:hypothetical protein ACFFGV_11760 [Pontibacillus salicampi]|uniref:Gamma-type small acid-soluble spore protein n=1 Tax=Pontibacillus salicampi TaxID=1449801 RepID=A0ABV6LPA2_9BACI